MSIQDYFHNPRNAGELDVSSPDVIEARVGTDEIIQLHVCIEKNKITDAKFKALGCPELIALSSYATEILLGKTIDEASKINHDVFVDKFNLQRTKLYCALLIEDAIKQTLNTLVETI